MLKSFRYFAIAWLCSASPLAAAEGHAAAWNETASASQALMGDYVGTWQSPPLGHYFFLNPPLAAQVIPIDHDSFRLRFFQEHDKRADLYFDGIGQRDGEVIRFSSDGWEGLIDSDGLTGSGTGHGKTVAFKLEKKVRKSPTLEANPPAGAIVLYDGSNFDAWQHPDGRAVTWHALDHGVMEVRSAEKGLAEKVGGDIRTKENFANFRLHLEFRYPIEPGKSGQGRGNSGLFLQGAYEVQILNSYGLDGNWNECGALYKTLPPQVSAARPPMEWQSYDVIYRSSIWHDGKRSAAPRISVWHNGVLIHHDVEIPHATSHAVGLRDREPQGPGPIVLQDHGNPLQFRNIWLEPLTAP